LNQPADSYRCVAGSRWLAIGGDRDDLTKSVEQVAAGLTGVPEWIVLYENML